DEPASAGWYGRAARAACAAIHARGRVPLLVGGSGLYLEAARSGLSEQPPASPAIRARLRAEIEAHGPEALHRRLAEGDPPSAARRPKNAPTRAPASSPSVSAPGSGTASRRCGWTARRWESRR